MVRDGDRKTREKELIFASTQVKNVWKFAGNAPMEGRKEESAVYPHPQQKHDILSGRLLITNDGDTTNR